MSLTTQESELESLAALSAELQEAKQRIATLEQKVEKAADTDAMNLVVFSDHLDRLLAAFVMATGAAACGMKVSMFFTFWGSAALRKGGRQQGKKSLVERAFGSLLPGSVRSTSLSKLNMGGMGKFLLSREMKKKNIADLEQLIATAGDLGVTLRVCEMSMNLMGIRREEIIDYPNLEYCGVAKFVDEASKANTNLFV